MRSRWRLFLRWHFSIETLPAVCIFCFARCADKLPQMFMVAACSDGCDFSSVLPRFAEVTDAVRCALELLSSWEPSVQVALVLCAISQTAHFHFI
jgi:hypothetical protein